MSALAIDTKVYAAPRSARAAVLTPVRPVRGPQARPAGSLAGTREVLPAHACSVAVAPVPMAEGAWELTRRGMAVGVVGLSSALVIGLVVLVMAFLAIPN